MQLYRGVAFAQTLDFGIGPGFGTSQVFKNGSTPQLDLHAEQLATPPDETPTSSTNLQVFQTFHLSASQIEPTSLMCTWWTEDSVQDGHGANLPQPSCDLWLWTDRTPSLDHTSEHGNLGILLRVQI